MPTTLLLPPPGISLAVGDARYVEIAGDTMTGPLLTTAITARSGETLIFNRQDGTAWATLSAATGATLIGITTNFVDDIAVAFGNVGDVFVQYSTAQANDGLVIAAGVGTAAQSGNIIITAAAQIAFDHAHAAATNPTFIVHSAAASTTQFISLTHNQTDALLNVGTGDLEISAASVRAPSGSNLVLARGDGPAAITIVNAGGVTIALATTFTDASQIILGTSADARFFWSTVQTNDALLLTTNVGSAAQSGNIIITAAAQLSFDHAHAAATDPTLIIHSANASTTEYVSLAHDQTDAILSVGAGDLALDALLRRFTIASITASTTQTQGNGPLTAEVNEISVVANTNDTITFPPAIAGRRILVINNGANTLQYFPASGDNHGSGVDASATMAAGVRLAFVAYDGTNWENI